MAHINILLDKHDATYNSGEVITGKVIVVLEESLSVEEMKISFIGEANVYGTHVSTHQQIVVDTQKVFSETMTLWPTGGTTSLLAMCAGKHQFNFWFPIPEKTPTGLPLPGDLSFVDPTNQRSGASIHYFLEVHARIVQPTVRFDQTLQKPVFIRGVYDLNTDPTASFPIAIADGKTICSWWCTSGRIDVSINMPKTGYAIGEYLALSAEIVNRSQSTIKQVRLELVQVSRCYSGEGSKWWLLEDAVIATAIRDDQILPGKTQSWENEGFPIPLFTRPTMSAKACRIIEYSHHLVMEVVPKACSSNFKVQIPVIIGTVPLSTPAPDLRSSVKSQVFMRVSAQALKECAV